MNPALLRLLIVDDEPLAHEVLRTYIGRVAHLTVAGHCYTAAEALAFLHQHPVDAVLLDIQMPEMSGLELLQALPQRPPVILTTAHSEFALESYEHGVIDYLVKPVPFPRFLKAVGRLRPTTPAAAVNSTPAPGPATAPEASAALLLRDGATTHRVPLADIQLLEAYGNYVKVHTAGGRLVVTDTLRRLLTELPEAEFVRVHKSYVVPLRRVERLESQQLTVAGQVLPLGAAFRQDFLRRWHQTAQ
ncbi:LytTR family DNA-binding domain-containing protein [Hymenobacter sp. J193]|uniref:LytR/AlgR family response regulator transcription factor n=1 Tax=Hymenobacter sp. J193 TaxID=2898429 RepID=UPI00215100A5|nr:LytTR family DNA-binding domain-containing protein [Hymenobacter sp. J193]MCR5889799.1 LytTR family DNA-binding domain-containing protein [Hymenobacter sp. J193]